MRVIAGTAKGRRLKSLPGPDTRPTGDKVKEALFSKLGGRVEGARVLDLYAGTGALGIEALSRGADSAVFVERNAAAVAVIRENLEATKMAERATVIKDAVDRLLSRQADEAFDIVLLDPPYRMGPPLGDLEALAQNQYLSPGCTIVLEVAAKNLPIQHSSGLTESSQARYGDTALVFLVQN